MKLAIKTVEGEFIARYSERGLSEMYFPGTFKGELDSTKPSAQVKQWHALTTQALKAILAGKEPDALPPMDLSDGTDFQRRVWQELCRIGFGRTKSYAEVAAAMGNSKATRAVGGACGKNPIPILVPCHRVLAANNKIGGFTSGLPWKRKLLMREKILLS